MRPNFAKHAAVLFSVFSVSFLSFHALAKEVVENAADENSGETQVASKKRFEREDAPLFSQAGFLTDEKIAKLALNFKEEAKRHPAGDPPLTEDLLAPDLITFRDAVIKTRDGESFFNVINDYSNRYDTSPDTMSNGLKYYVARMATILPFRGIVWRMTPLVHQVVVTQEILLATLKNMAEQVEIHDPNSHIEAQMAFLTMPFAKNRVLPTQFKNEDEFVDFLARDVYGSLAKAVKRLEDLPEMTWTDPKGKKIELVFDSKIRFGEGAFGEAYGGFDRYKRLGETERFAAIARYHHRMAQLSQMAAYTWTGHLQLRKKIGQEFGFDAIKSNLPGYKTDEFIGGVSREKRVGIIHSAEFSPTYILIEDKRRKKFTGHDWMRNAYAHLHKTYEYLDKSWKNIEEGKAKGAPTSFWQIDPGMLEAREAQVQQGLENMKKLVGVFSDDPIQNAKLSGLTTINGALSGDPLTVDFKSYFEAHPPADLKNLSPKTNGPAHDREQREFLAKIRKLYPDAHARVKGGSETDVVEMTVAGKKVAWRNYLYGRALDWNFDAYSTLFPALKSGADVSNAQRILAETRGTRMLSGMTGMFIR